MGLTAEQLRALRDDGYVVLPEFLPRGELDLWRAEIDRLPDRIAGGVPPGVEVAFEQDVVPDQPPQVLQLLHAELLTPALEKLITSETLLDLVSPALGDAVGLLHAKLLMKSSVIGSAVPWHQDFAYWHQETAEPVHLNCMIYFDDADEENGCLTAVPRSHCLGLLPHGYRGPGTFDATLTPPDQGVVSLPGRAGTVLLFGPLLSHGSAPNRSTRARRACTIAFTIPGNGLCRRVLRRAQGGGPESQLLPRVSLDQFVGRGPHGGQCQSLYRTLELWRYALDLVPAGTPWVQVGVGSFGQFEWLASRKPPGLPMYRVDPLPLAITPDPNIKVVPHVTELLSQARLDNGVGLLHLQAFLYPTVSAALDAVPLRAGSVMLIDRFFGFDGWQGQAARALTEVMRSKGLAIEYLGRTDRAIAARVSATGVSPRATARPVRWAPRSQGIVVIPGDSASNVEVRHPKQSSLPERVVVKAKLLRGELTLVGRAFRTERIPRFVGAEVASPCPPHSERRALWAYALSFVGDETGTWAEFGVGAGESLDWFSWHKPVNNVLVGFDSFEGLPEPWLEQPVGQWRAEPYSTDRPDVHIVTGLFQDSLARAEVKTLLGERLAFVHIDCDLYSSTCAVFAGINEQISAGVVIVFDEFSGFLGWEHGEAKAFMEFCRRQRVEFEYLARTDWQVAVRIVSRGSRFAVHYRPYEPRVALPHVRVVSESDMRQRLRADVVSVARKARRRFIGSE